MMKTKISVQNLHMSFGTKKVLQGINLDIKNSESMVILGGSGSGKSVLIKTIIGLLTPISGSVKLDDQEITNIDSKKFDEIIKKFGFLFQGGALFDSLKIWENISFVQINNQKIPANIAFDHAVQKLEQVGLTADVANLYPSELSGGMQKRASLARAISLNPEVIFFDEPTTGLDPIMSGVINELIVKTCKELGATAITITHDIHSAKIIGDRAAMIYEGKIIWQDTIDKLDNCENPYVAQFVKGSTTGPIQIKLQDH